MNGRPRVRHLKPKRDSSGPRFLHRLSIFPQPCRVPTWFLDLTGLPTTWSKSMPPSFTHVSPGEHRSASQDAAARLGPLRSPISIRSRCGCDLHLPQAANGTDTASTQSSPHLCASVSPHLSFWLYGLQDKLSLSLFL